MRKHIIAFFFTLLIAVAGTASVATHVPNQLIVMLYADSEVGALCSDLSKRGNSQFEVVKTLSHGLNIYLLEFDDSLDDLDALRYAQRNRSVKIAQFNHSNLELRSLPNDSLFYRQWSFLNDGTNGGAGLSDISAEDAWTITTGGLSPAGDTIVVAVIDQGVQANHPDLRDNLFVNRNEIQGNGIDDDGNGFIDDFQGWDFYGNDPFQPIDNHGSHVCGTVGATGNNEIGVTGVNWNVKVLSVTGSSTLESTVVEAYAYVLKMRKMYNNTNGKKGAYVVSANSSFGVNNGDPAEYPLWCAMFDSLGYEGVLSVGATANDDVDVDEVGDIPTACSSNFLITVTNMRSNDELNINAGFGATTIDLGAPGSNIYSTTAGDSYGFRTGTSMAAPHVSGAIGLMYSGLCEGNFNLYANHPDELALFIKDKMLNEGVDQVSALSDNTVTGGRLNLEKCILSVSTLCPSIVFDGINSQCDSCNGEIKATVLGTDGELSYMWSTGASDDSIGSLCPGIYFLTVIDENNDSIISGYALSDSGGPEISISKTDLTCYNSIDGAVTVTGGFNHSWYDGGNNTSRNALAGGRYFLTATDSLGVCSTSVKVDILIPTAVDADYRYVEPSSDSASDGSLTAMPNGGNAPYSYLWETGDTIATIENKPIGKYGLTITDANGCVFADSAWLGSPIGVRSFGRLGSDFNVFPNPSSGSINMVWNGDIAQVSIMDIQGSMIWSGRINSNQTATVAGMPAGVYLVQLHSELGTFTNRLIVTNAR